MRKIRIVEITLVCLILLSYFIPFISINILEKQTVSILEIVFDSGYSPYFNIMTGFLLIPVIASVITMMVNSEKYPFVSFLMGISVIFGIAPITASKLYSSAGEPSIGLILMAFSGVMLLSSGLLRGCWYYKKNWIFLTCIVGIAVIPALFYQYMLLLTLTMAYTLFPIMGITILISFLVNHKKCLPRAVAEEIERRKANNTLNKFLKTMDAPTLSTTAQVTDRIGEQNDALASAMSEYLCKVETKTDEELKSILQNEGDYHPQLVKAAEKVLLDRITGVVVPMVVAPTNNEDKNKVYQPGTQKEEETKEEEAPVTLSQSPQLSQPSPQVEKTSVASPSKPNDTMLISILIGALLVIGGVLGYFLWYAPYAKDRDAPRTYVVANSVFLRSSQLGGIEYNILGRVSYGAEVITYSRYGEWAEVKVNGQKGFVSSAYLLDASDFNLLNSVWGDNDAKECIESSKCRLAILNYYKNNRLKSGTNGWQIYTRMKDQKPNAVFYPRIYNKNSKFTDFVFILKNVKEGGKRIITCYSFEDETEKPIFRFSTWGPIDGYIQNILPTRDGVNIVFDTGTRTKIEIQ